MYARAPRMLPCAQDVYGMRRHGRAQALVNGKGGAGWEVGSIGVNCDVKRVLSCHVKRVLSCLE